MRSAFNNSTALALALLLAGFGTTAHAGGKSPTPAYDVTLENGSYDFYGLRLTYPKIEIKGANIPKAEIERAFSAETSLADRLAMAKNFTAASVDISSVTGTLGEGTVKGELSCSGLKLEKVAGGKIGKLSLGGCSVQSTDKSDGSLKIVLGPSSLNDYNFVHAYRLWADKAGPDDKETVPIYGSGTFGGFSLSLTGSDNSFQMAGDRWIESAGPKAKLLSQPISDVARQISALAKETPKTVTSTVLRQAGLIAIEFIENYESSISIVENYRFSFMEQKKGQDIPQKIGVEVARIETRGGNQQFSGISFTAADVAGTIASASWKDYSGTPFLAELKKFITRPESEADAQNGIPHIYSAPLGQFAETTLPLTLAPYSALGTISARELDMTLSNVKLATADGPATQDAKVTFNTFTLRLEQPFNGFPTAGRVAVENLRIPAALAVGPASKGTDFRPVLGLRQVGLDPLDLSYAIDLAWNREAGTLSINEYSFAVTGFFGFTAKGTLGNASDDLFSWNTQARDKAFDNLTAKEASLRIDDEGGIDKMVRVAAANRGVTPDELKAFFPIMVATIPQPYVGMKSVRTIRDAVLAFWQSPGKLDITVKARKEAGLGLADLVAAQQDPKTLDDKVEVTVTSTK